MSNQLAAPATRIVAPASCRLSRRHPAGPGHRKLLIVSPLLLALLASLPCRAEQAPDLNVSTPAIGRLKQEMSRRAEAIARYKDFGQIGEGRDGLLAVRTLEGLDLAKKKEVEDLVAAENADRRSLYREILVANGLRDQDAPRVMELAARSRRAAAAPGHHVQDPGSGAWVLKRDLRE